MCSTLKWVDRATTRLAAGGNSTTEVRVVDLIGDGLKRGESVEHLTNRVSEWFGEETTAKRAERIARTESARAYVEGQEAAWELSGVVDRKQWLLAPKPCEFCRAAAAEWNEKGGVPIGQAFYKRGHVLTGDEGGVMRLDYSDVSGPPLHPNCRCDLIPVLEGES